MIYSQKTASIKLLKAQGSSPLTLKLFLIVTLTLILSVSLVSADWWDTNWNNRKPVNITGGKTILNNFTVLVNVTYDSGMRPNFNDIRFINGSCSGIQNAQLGHELDKVINSNSALVWVRIPNLQTETNEICMYYSNTAVNDGSDPLNTWDPNYKGVYHLTNSSGNGSIIFDSTGNGNGTINGSITRVMQGAIGNGILLDNNGFLNLSNNDALEFNHPDATLEIWINITGDTISTPAFLAGGLAVGNFYTRVGPFASCGAGSFLRYGNVGGFEVYPCLSPADDVQNYVSWILAGSQSIVKLNDLGNDTLPAITGTTSTFDVGLTSGSAYFTGQVDEIRISNIARTEDWVNRSYQNTNISLFSFGPEESAGFPAEILSQTFNITTFESDVESFQILVNYNTSIYTTASASLIYNGTIFSGTKSENGNNVTFSKTQFLVPLNPTSADENNEFFWSITISNLTSTITFNSSVNSQNVEAIGFGICAGTTSIPTLNFTSLDEALLTKINNFNIAGTLSYFIGSSTLAKTISFENSTINESILCINRNTDYTINGQINYFKDGDDYVSRHYYFSNFKINNITQNISLFLLNASDSTSFIVKLQSEDLLPLSNYVIEIQRFYPGTNTFKIVQGINTDSNGEGIGFFKTETIDYRFVVKKDGVIFLTTTKQKIIPLATPFRIILTLPSEPGSPWDPLEDISDLTKTLLFDSTTKIFSASYVDTSNNFTNANLLVFQLNYSGANRLICNETSTNPTDILSCDLSGEINGTYIGNFYVTRGGTRLFIESQTFSIQNLAEIFGNLGLILGFFILLILASMFFFHTIAGIWAMTLGVIFLNFIGVINFGGVFVTGILALTIIITMLLKR